MTFDPLTPPKPNQHNYEPNYICDRNWVKFAALVFEIWCSQGSVIFVLIYFLSFSFSFSFASYQNIKPALEDVLMICLNAVHR